MQRNTYTFLEAKLFGLLCLLAVPSILRVLCFSKQSSDDCSAFNRYFSTLSHMFEWYKGDLLEPGSKWVEPYLWIFGNVIFRFLQGLSVFEANPHAACSGGEKVSKDWTGTHVTVRHDCHAVWIFRICAAESSIFCFDEWTGWELGRAAALLENNWLLAGHWWKV